MIPLTLKAWVQLGWRYGELRSQSLSAAPAPVSRLYLPSCLSLSLHSAVTTADPFVVLRLSDGSLRLLQVDAQDMVLLISAPEMEVRLL